MAVKNLSLAVASGGVFRPSGTQRYRQDAPLHAIEALKAMRSGQVRSAESISRRTPWALEAVWVLGLPTTAFQAGLTLQELIRLFAALYGVHLSFVEALSKRGGAWDA